MLKYKFSSGGDQQLSSSGEEDGDLSDPRRECWINQTKDALVVLLQMLEGSVTQGWAFIVDHK